MPHFRPFLMNGLRNYEDYHVCAVAVGVVGDVCRALVNKMVPYCDEIVSLLLQDLQVRSYSMVLFFVLFFFLLLLLFQFVGALLTFLSFSIYTYTESLVA